MLNLIQVNSLNPESSIIHVGECQLCLAISIKIIWAERSEL